MSVYGAMLTAVSGMRAQGAALENISGNIANSRTTGYKRVDTDFLDLIPDAPLHREQGASVIANGRNTAALQGDLTTTQVGTNMAINGSGMFVVQSREGATGLTSLPGAEYYTRRGDFELDRDGYLVNGSGYALKGLTLDPRTGAATGSTPSLIRIDAGNAPARASANVAYRGNLPSYPATAAADAAVPGSELLTSAGFAVDPTAGGAGYVTGADASRFLDRSIPGGAVTLYNEQGAPVDVQLRWAKTQNAAGGGDVWNLFYQENATATGAAPAWRNAGTAFAFDAAGALTSGATVSLSGTANGAAFGPAAMDFGTGGLTQFASGDGQAEINAIAQDGYPSGTLDSVTVAEGGTVVGVYSNGQVLGLAKVALAQFNGDNGLKRRDGGAFEQTMESGAPTFVDGGRTVVGGALENSNADISEEFSRMIVTQQAYSANTRVISTSQQMLQDVLNIIR